MHRVFVIGSEREALIAAFRAAGVDASGLAAPSLADLTGVDCLVGFRWPAGVDVPVPWIHVTGLGLDGFADAPRPGLMTRTVGSMPVQMGRYVVGAVASFSERHGELAQAQRRREWLAVGARSWPTTAVVLGTGLAAQGVARALGASGLSVVGVNRSGRPVPTFERVVAFESLGSVLPGAGVVVNLLPLTAATDSVVGASVFEALSGVLFVNPGRGATVVEPDLMAALDAGHVAEAWLDVHRVEPLPAEHWAWSHPRVRVTPHIAAVTTPDDVVSDWLAARDALVRGEVPPTAVEPAAY